MSEELELAYLAGVMDSDGWFTIKREDRPGTAGTRWVGYSEHVGCGQIGADAVELLRARFGGTIRLRSRKGHPTWRPMHYWVRQGPGAADLAHQLKPYLRLKRKHAEILTELRASIDQPFGVTRSEITDVPRGRRLAPEVIAHRHGLWLQIRSMNDRRIRVEDVA